VREIMVEKTSRFTYEFQQLEEVAGQLLQIAGNLNVWIFKGEMGVGKTTLIKSIAKQLGVKDIVQSPTFSIVNEYSAVEKKLFHFDFYRIKNEEEAFDIGVEEYFYSDNFCLIEWPEKIPTLLPDTFFEVSICMQENGLRKLECKRHE
jgi:tRNA threonylcarbamoyladenosine biosynthesis protein TsaE